MMQGKKRASWSTGQELVSSFQYRAGVSGDRMAILNTVWHKELGHMSKYWDISGFKNGILFVKPRSAAAAQELQLRSSSVVRSLNKYFDRPWIKGIKASTR
jgi:hypothetical protein